MYSVGLILKSCAALLLVPVIGLLFIYKSHMARHILPFVVLRDVL